VNAPAMALLKRENGAWVPVQPGDLPADVLADIAAASEGTASARRIAEHIAANGPQGDASEPAHQAEEQLQRAFECLRSPNWPDTMREALRDPVRGRLIRMTAQRMQDATERLAKDAMRMEQASATAKSSMGSPGNTVTRTALPAPPPHPLRRCTDLKRAAAGDREDD
jgi:hypothetical protein